MVAAGDEVKSGDVLISGMVEVTNATTQEVTKTYCEADGDVAVISTLTYEERFPMKYQEKVFTGKEMDITLFLPRHARPSLLDHIDPYDAYDTLIMKEQVTAGNGYFLPLDQVRVIKKEYEMQMVERTQADAKEKVKEDFSFYLQNLAEKGVQTLEKNVIISYEDGECLARGTLQVQQYMDQKLPTSEEIAVEEGNSAHELQ